MLPLLVLLAKDTKAQTPEYIYCKIEIAGEREREREINSWN